MSRDWVRDIEEMHEKFEFHKTVDQFDEEKFYQLLHFRFRFLDEELGEGQGALEDGDIEEVVDALIDLCVVAIGTLDLMGVDSYKAWDAVHKANMSKERGIKPGRPNPLGLPDLMKPEGWVGPSHEGNHGKFT
jgi:predicted HAD superfamily Cof-like phosphohydrolase